MSQEYRLDDVLQVLAADDPVKTLIEDSDMLSAMLVYCKTDFHVIASRIMDESKTPKEVKNSYIKGLISLYPISSAILDKIILNDQNMLSDVSSYIDQFDVSEVMRKCFTKFCSILTNSAQNCISDTKMLTRAIEMYDERIAKLNDQIAEVRKYQETQKDKHNEVLRLEREYNLLKEEWSPDAIEMKIQKTKADIAQAKKDKEEPEKKLKALIDELNKIQGSTNASFDKKLKALNETLGEMPKDVSES